MSTISCQISCPPGYNTRMISKLLTSLLLVGTIVAQQPQLPVTLDYILLGDVITDTVKTDCPGCSPQLLEIDEGAGPVTLSTTAESAITKPGSYTLKDSNDDETLLEFTEFNVQPMSGHCILNGTNCDEKSDCGMFIGFEFTLTSYLGLVSHGSLGSIIGDFGEASITRTNTVTDPQTGLVVDTYVGTGWLDGSCGFEIDVDLDYTDFDPAVGDFGEGVYNGGDNDQVQFTIDCSECGS